MKILAKLVHHPFVLKTNPFMTSPKLVRSTSYILGPRDFFEGEIDPKAAREGILSCLN